MQSYLQMWPWPESEEKEWMVMKIKADMGELAVLLIAAITD